MRPSERSSRGRHKLPERRARVRPDVAHLAAFGTNGRFVSGVKATAEAMILGPDGKMVIACAAIERDRNAAGSSVNWRFTDTDARVKLM